MTAWLDSLAARHARAGRGQAVIAAVIIIPGFLASVQVSA